MPRLIQPELGNGRRPSDPLHSSGAPNDTVPVLDVGDDTHELVGAVHDAALDPDDDTQLLTGTVVYIDNPRPVSTDIATHTMFVIGGSTLHEAATEVIGAMVAHGRDMPDWVASTDPELAKVLAEHYTVDLIENGEIVRYTCRVIDMSEVSS